MGRGLTPLWGSLSLAIGLISPLHRSSLSLSFRLYRVQVDLKVVSCVKLSIPRECGSRWVR